MRQAKLALGLIAVLGAMSLVASTAQAAPIWQSCEKGGTSPEFVDSLCSKTTGTKEWSWLETTPFSTIVTIHSTAENIWLTDIKGGAFGESVTVECESSGSGKVSGASARKGKIESLRFLKCTTIAGTCPEPTAASVNLEWETELTEPMAGTIRDKIKNGGSGAPGFKITCKIGMGVEDTCTGETSAKAVNEHSEGYVKEEFEGSSEKLTCTRGGANAGSIAGTNKILRMIEAGLRVH